MQIMDARKGRFYTLTAPERDRQIVQLRQRGWTYAKIGRAVGMTESGVRRSIERIREGGFGQGQAPR
jgi:IS30 family transposase